MLTIIQTKEENIQNHNHIKGFSLSKLVKKKVKFPLTKELWQKGLWLATKAWAGQDLSQKDLFSKENPTCQKGSKKFTKGDHTTY